MERLKEHPYSTILGLLFIAFAITLLFVPTLYQIPLWGLGLITVLGILLLFAKDKLVDILTLGLSRFFQDANNRLK